MRRQAVILGIGMILIYLGSSWAGPNPALEPPPLQGQPPTLPMPFNPDLNIPEEVRKYILNTTPDPESYEDLDWSAVVELEEYEQGPYKYAVRHTYRVSHPWYRILYIDRLFLMTHHGQVEGIIEYTRRPCFECRWD